MKILGACRVLRSYVYLRGIGMVWAAVSSARPPRLPTPARVLILATLVRLAVLCGLVAAPFLQSFHPVCAFAGDCTVLLPLCDRSVFKLSLLVGLLSCLCFLFLLSAVRGDMSVLLLCITAKVPSCCSRQRLHLRCPLCAMDCVSHVAANPRRGNVRAHRVL